MLSDKQRPHQSHINDHVAFQERVSQGSDAPYSEQTLESSGSSVQETTQTRAPQPQAIPLRDIIRQDWEDGVQVIKPPHASASKEDIFVTALVFASLSWGAAMYMNCVYVRRECLRADRCGKPFQLPLTDGVYYLVLMIIFYLSQFVWLAIRMHQLRTGYHRLSYYRHEFVNHYNVDICSIVAYLAQCGAAVIIRMRLSEQDVIKSTMLSVGVSGLQLVSAAIMALSMKYSIQEMVLRGSLTEETAAWNEQLTTILNLHIRMEKRETPGYNLEDEQDDFQPEKKPTRVKSRRSIMQFKVYREFEKILGHDFRSAHITYLILSGIFYLSAGIYEFSVAFKWMSLLFFALLFSLAVFSWFYIENFVLKDLSVLYVSPWLVLVLVLGYSYFDRSIDMITAENLARDFFVGSSLMGLCVKIVITIKIREYCNELEEDDLFDYARTSNYRYCVTDKYAVDSQSEYSVSSQASDDNLEDSNSESLDALTSAFDYEHSLLNVNPGFLDSSSNVNSVDLRQQEQDALRRRNNLYVSGEDSPRTSPNHS